MSKYFPDGWVVIQVDTNDYRVFGSWRGSYLTGDSWRCNSGIAAVIDSEVSYSIVGDSGSIYDCYKTGYDKLGSYNSSVVADIIQRQLDGGRDARILSEDAAFEFLNSLIKE